MYQITDYTKDKAKQAGLTVKVSKRKGKKIDVYQDGDYLASVGGEGYSDYPHYIQSHGLKFAEERRRLYHLRHKKQSLGERLASLLLW
jgi:hypothetical protein